MRSQHRFAALAVLAISIATAFSASGARAEGTSPSTGGAQPEREWTFLVYLNGHNSLDSFGPINMHDMEKVGSTPRVNVVVQWASMGFAKTKRLFVKKQTMANPSVNDYASTVVEEVPTVDMGDWHNLVEFVKWGAKNYPAKHYFVNVWDHGGGWHLDAAAAKGVHSLDISWDDRTGNVIKTEELGQAMGEIADAIGHKVDIYGSDACLMAMGEVAAEMATSVETFVGSQETEPGAGWPYFEFLNRWNALPDATSLLVGRTLAHAYVESYSGGSNGTSPATMSVYDMSKLDGLMASVGRFSAALAQLDKTGLAKALSAARASQSFAYSDYVDLVDFANRLGNLSGFSAMAEIADVKGAASALLAFNEANSSFRGANGLSIWLPTNLSLFREYKARYADLAFNKVTGWLYFLTALVH